MKLWHFTRFLWEEDRPPPGPPPSPAQEETAGVPPFVRRAARFTLIGTLAVTMMSQIVGVRLVARVDADDSYRQHCLQGCDTSEDSCRHTARATFLSCRSGCKKGKAGHACRVSCRQTFRSSRSTCESNDKTCRHNCKQINHDDDEDRQEASDDSRTDGSEDSSDDGADRRDDGS
jgi:hypothetical protein